MFDYPVQPILTQPAPTCYVDSSHTSMLTQEDLPIGHPAKTEGGTFSTNFKPPPRSNNAPSTVGQPQSQASNLPNAPASSYGDLPPLDNHLVAKLGKQQEHHASQSNSILGNTSTAIPTAFSSTSLSLFEQVYNPPRAYTTQPTRYIATTTKSA
jgi:hypothetical protein